MTVQDDQGAATSSAISSLLGDRVRRKALAGLGTVPIRPLSDPGAPGRVAPFACVGIIAVVILLLPSASSDRPILAVGAVMVVIHIAAMLLIPWARFPDWCQASPVLTAFAVIALIRHGSGGATSAYTPLFMLLVLWLAIYGSRAQVWLAIVAMAAAFLAPMILIGQPRYPSSGWREAVIWVAIALLVGTSTQTLVNNSRHRVADVAALGAIARALTGGSDPRPELCAAAQIVTRAAFVVLLEKDTDGTLAASAGSEGVDLALIRIDPATEVSATAEVWRTAKAIYVADATSDPRASARLAMLTGGRAALCQPVTRDGAVAAVLVIGFYESRREVPEQEMFLVELLAAEIGAAIERADLVALLDAQSRSDPLTGAANRRSWDDEINRELARARRTGDPLTVAILDMDHFKAYNDEFGHLAGDVLLKDLVTSVRAELRTGDIIARWGGEEFALAQPECDLHQALTIASRLLTVVPGGQTASIGLTQARAQDTPRALIERADTALYAAKSGGRNQVKTYQAPQALGVVSDHGA